MEIRSLDAGWSATFETHIPAGLTSGDYRYATRVESPPDESGREMAVEFRR
jgi:hypothetical protein